MPRVCILGIVRLEVAIRLLCGPASFHFPRVPPLSVPKERSLPIILDNLHTGRPTCKRKLHKVLGAAASLPTEKTRTVWEQTSFIAQITLSPSRCLSFSVPWMREPSHLRAAGCEVQRRTFQRRSRRGPWAIPPSAALVRRIPHSDYRVGGSKRRVQVLRSDY